MKTTDTLPAATGDLAGVAATADTPNSAPKDLDAASLPASRKSKLKSGRSAGSSPTLTRLRSLRKPKPAGIPEKSVPCYDVKASIHPTCRIGGPNIAPVERPH